MVLHNYDLELKVKVFILGQNFEPECCFVTFIIRTPSEFWNFNRSEFDVLN